MGWGLNQYRLVRIYMRRPCKGYYMRWYYNGWHYWFFLPGKSLVLTEGERYRTYGTKKVSMCSGQVTQSQIDAIRTIFNSKEVAIYTNAGWMNIRIEHTSMVVYSNQIAGYEMDFTALIGSKEISYITGYSPIIDIPVIDITVPPITYCEITIGTQVWACKNVDILYPGSKVYNDDEANRAIYGGLYTFAQIIASNFAPVGWHVPTLEDWEELINYLGGATMAGAKLKETGVTHWNYEAADNSSGFAALGGGMYSSVYVLLREQANFWTKSKFPCAASIQLTDTSIDVMTLCLSKSNYLSVRLIKDSSIIPPPMSFDDWFMPSQDGVYFMYNNLHLFGVGGFAAAGYWSSTENNDTQAVYWDFSDGFNYNDLKTASHRVRACRSFISSDIYSLRDTGPAGGKIFHIADNGNGTFTYQEAAPVDQSAGRSWSDITNQAVGGTSQGVEGGRVNTDLIVAQVVEATNYFLPSKDELNKMYRELHLFTLGGFTNNWYQSSSEYYGTPTLNEAIDFTDGSNYQSSKGVENRVRACRVFTTNIIYSLRDTGPAGGLIFWIINNGGGLFTYFEAAPTDQSAAQKWSNIIDAIGTTLTAIGTGPANTMMIINQPGHTDSAAKLCNDLNTGGTTVDSAAKLCDDLVT